VYVQDIDVSERSVVALCSCGWRMLLGSADRGVAWAAARSHAAHAHPGAVDHATSRNASRWQT
jgi:hypothetical protein